jgi:hypothetical protein
MGLEETTMSLTPKRRMTEKNLAAHRTNAQHSRGAVTPAGKRRAAPLPTCVTASMTSPEVLDALGEDAPPQVDLNRALSYYQKEIDEIESAANRAAMMAPNGEKADHLQRMEDASLRQLWRLTNLWMKVRNGEMHPKNKKSYKCSG